MRCTGAGGRSDRRQDRGATLWDTGLRWARERHLAVEAMDRYSKVIVSYTKHETNPPDTGLATLSNGISTSDDHWRRPSRTDFGFGIKSPQREGITFAFSLGL